MNGNITSQTVGQTCTWTTETAELDYPKILVYPAITCNMLFNTRSALATNNDAFDRSAKTPTIITDKRRAWSRDFLTDALSQLVIKAQCFAAAAKTDLLLHTNAAQVLAMKLECSFYTRMHFSPKLTFTHPVPTALPLYYQSDLMISSYTQKTIHNAIARSIDYVTLTLLFIFILKQKQSSKKQQKNW